VTAPTPLEQKLRRLIAAQGPMRVAHYMAHCLGDPEFGYYRTRDPLGMRGDFVTAPEISQMFGELVGLWAVAIWRQMGAPASFVLAELGPGRGTLMADALRAAQIEAGFVAAATVHLVETSPVLRRMQKEALGRFAAQVVWHDAIATLPEAPAITIANEFFDALPIYQAVRKADGWHERMVGLDEEDRLSFGLHGAPIPDFERTLPPGLTATDGAIFEWRSDAELNLLCWRLQKHGGAALVIDYGHVVSGFGDTLQAVHRHGFADPLAALGETDLTAHVDFAAMARVGRALGAAVQGPAEQGVFLRRLGIEVRAERLTQKAMPQQREAIDAAYVRLTGGGPGEMGGLFKALAFSHPALGSLPGFDN
jgi:SAM-dependent MidA family methyltransferase